jgi:hypothetical protein
VATALNGVPHRLLEQFDQASPIGWSQDGKDLYVEAGSWEESDMRKLSLSDNQLVRISPESGMFRGQTDGKFIYFERLGRPFSLVRIPATGGTDELVVDNVLFGFIICGNDICFERQDGNPPTPQGLNFFRFDMTAHTSKLIGKGLGSRYQMSGGPRFIYAEQHNPTSTHIMVLQNWK